MGNALSCRSSDSVEVINSIRRVQELPEIRGDDLRRHEPEPPDVQTPEPPKPVVPEFGRTDPRSSEVESPEAKAPGPKLIETGHDKPQGPESLAVESESHGSRSPEPEPLSAELDSAMGNSEHCHPLGTSNTTTPGISQTEENKDLKLKKLAQKLNEKDKDGNTLLHKNAAEGDDARIKELIQQGAKVHVMNRVGQTPLQIAIRKLRRSTVKVLLESGANCHIPDIYGRIPLHTATETGDVDLVKDVLKVGVKVDAQDGSYWTSLHMAASEGHTGIVRLLLEAGANPNLQDSSHFTPLHLASSLGHLDIVIALTEYGVHYDMITSFGETVLHMAVRDKQEDIVCHLVKGHPDEKFVNAVDFRQESPLHLAAKRGMLKSVRALVENGAKVDLKDTIGITAIHKAVSCGHVETVEYLINAKCDVNIQNGCGVTALHIAVGNYDNGTRGSKDFNCINYLAIIKQLLMAKANPWLRSIADGTVVFFAIKSEVMQPHETNLQLLRTVLNYGDITGKTAASELPHLTEQLVSVLSEPGLCFEQVANVLTLLLSARICSYGDCQSIYSRNMDKDRSMSIPLDLRALCRLCIREHVGHGDVKMLAIPNSLKLFVCFDCPLND